MALETHTDLNETPTGKDDADRSDNAEYDVRHVLDCLFRIAVGEDRNHKAGDDAASQSYHEIALQDRLLSRLTKDGYFVCFVVFLHDVNLLLFDRFCRDPQRRGPHIRAVP